jgi:hypothetical protein
MAIAKPRKRRDDGLGSIAPRAADVSWLNGSTVTLREERVLDREAPDAS